MFGKREKMVLFCPRCICFSLLPVFSFSHFHSSIVTLLPFLLLQSFKAIHHLSFSRVLSWLFHSVSVYLLAFFLVRFLILKLFSCALWSLFHPSSLFLLCSSFRNILINQEICPHLHSSWPMLGDTSFPFPLVREGEMQLLKFCPKDVFCSPH